MEQFGAVAYAVLCKASGDMKVEDLEDAATHKGTGFVRFKSLKDANAICDLSQDLERRLDKEHKSRAKDKAKDLVGASSLLKGELELNGRRMVVLP
jgi:hypothetical protein